jgi:hypothetical protein
VTGQLSLFPELTGWLAYYECGHVGAARSDDGHLYGQARVGQRLTCRQCQGQRRVVRVVEAGAAA